MPLCSTCRSFMEIKVKTLFTENFSVRHCRICGKELISEKETCLFCREKPLLTSTEKVFPLFSYRLWNKELMFQWKIEGQRVLSPFFAALINEAIKKIKEQLCLKNICIVPVPPRPGKIKEKGWDQIDELCMYLSHRWGYHILPLLQRNSGEQQKKRSRIQRLEKIEGDYSLSSKFNFNEIENDFFCEPVIILDDVITTGATIEKCAALLKHAGFRKIFALTLFTVD